MMMEISLLMRRRMAKPLNKVYQVHVRCIGSVGIVGMPNVGKSSLFNALTRTQLAQVSNYPFCTIDPNVAKVSIPDERLKKLSDSIKSQKTIYEQLQLHDIAGLIKGASSGSGLGNQFLSNIKETDAIIHLVRCFRDDKIIHVDGNKHDPVNDIDVIRTELLLADLSHVEKQMQALTKKKKGGKTAANDQEEKALFKIIEKIHEHLTKGERADEILKGDFVDSVIVSNVKPHDSNSETLKLLKKAKLIDLLRRHGGNHQLLTLKPEIVVANVDEGSLSDPLKNELIQQVTKSLNEKPIVLCCSLEEQLAKIEDDNERNELMAEYGIKETGLDQIVKHCAKILGVQVFFTLGQKEARAWRFKIGDTVAKASSIIHSDIERGFICAETIAWDVLLNEFQGNEDEAKKKGKIRIEGKEYRARDGDVYHFRFNV